MRRRAALAALGSSLAGLAGCPSRAQRSDGRTVTPAPVPSAERDTVEPRVNVPEPTNPCPELPAGADTYVCPETTGPDEDAVLLYPSTDALVVGDDPEARRIDFRMDNRTTHDFTTGLDWWLVATRGGDSWNVLAEGARDERRVAEPGDVFTWTLDVAGGPIPTPTGPRNRTLSMDLPPGRHAFAVSGYFNGTGEVGLVARFVLADPGESDALD